MKKCRLIFISLVCAFFIFEPAPASFAKRRVPLETAISEGQAQRNRWPVSLEQELNQFRNIVIDVRGSRGGHGDVAAGYLTALDLLNRLQYRGSITFIMEEKAQDILRKLIDQPIQPGGVTYGGKIRFHTLASLPLNFPTVDLYLSMANPFGANRFKNDFDVVSPNIDVRRAKRNIPVDHRTVRIFQTVLGNTESNNPENPNALVQVGSASFDLRPAGLGAEEAGIYFDTVALGLRGKNESKIREFLNSTIGHMQDAPVRSALLKIVNRKTLCGATLGLAYGITLSDVKPQFETYLTGLAVEAGKTGRSFALVTPSGFSIDQIKDEAIKRRLTVVDLREEAAPVQVDSGRIYIIKTGVLPHRVFTGLMAYSEMPYIVAGDGAMSSAIVLGKPFVMTQIEWNLRNLNNLVSMLQRHLIGARAAEIADMLRGSRFQDILALQEQGPAFEVLLKEVSPLTDYLVHSAADAKRIADAARSIPKILRVFSDPQLRAGALINAYESGKRGALGTLIEVLREDEELMRGLLEEAALPAKLLRTAGMRNLINARYLTSPDIDMRKVGYQALRKMGGHWAVAHLGEAFLNSENHRWGVAEVIIRALADIGTSEAFILLENRGPLDPDIYQECFLLLISQNQSFRSSSVRINGYLNLLNGYSRGQLYDRLTYGVGKPSLNDGVTAEVMVAVLTSQDLKVPGELSGKALRLIRTFTKRPGMLNQVSRILMNQPEELKRLAKILRVSNAKLIGLACSHSLEGVENAGELN